MTGPPAVHADDMTTIPRHADDDSREEQALRAYTDDPMEDGDALLLLDDTVCLEIEGLANQWDDAGRRGLVDMLTTTSRRVQVAIARRGGKLLPSDYQLWRELHQELRDTDIELLPVRALPAV